MHNMCKINQYWPLQLAAAAWKLGHSMYGFDARLRSAPHLDSLTHPSTHLVLRVHIGRAHVHDHPVSPGACPWRP
jgi:hypothetical protein